MVEEVNHPLDQVSDLNHRVRRFSWFRESFKQKAGALVERYGLSLAVDDRALAQAFFDWALAFQRERPNSTRNRRDFTVFSGGVMLQELLRAGSVRKRGRGEFGQFIPPDPMARICEFWPEGFFCTDYCLVLVRAILEQDYDLHLSPIPALQDLRTWQSFRENFIENPSSAISFFDVFMGQKPNWDFPEHFLSRPAVRRSEALMLWPSVFPPD